MAPTIMMRPTKKDWQRQSQSESEDDDMVGKKDLLPLVMTQGENKFSHILLIVHNIDGSNCIQVYRFTLSLYMP